MTNNDKAAAKVLAIINAGHVVHGHAASGSATVGPLHKAVDDGYKFAIFGYGKGRDKPTDGEYRTAKEASYAFVAKCGSTRAREAAISAAKKNNIKL